MLLGILNNSNTNFLLRSLKMLDLYLVQIKINARKFIQWSIFMFIFSFCYTINIYKIKLTRSNCCEYNSLECANYSGTYNISHFP